MIRQCVILAGGDGTRLKPLWDGPKTLVPVKGKPFALYQLEWLARQGVWEVVYCAGEHCDAIRNVVGQAQFGMRLKYCDDGDCRGTAGALAAAYKTCVLAPRFFVLYGDSYLRLSLVDFARDCEEESRGIEPTVAALRNDGVLAPSNISLSGDDHYREIDCGVWVFTRERAGTLPLQGTLIDVMLPRLACWMVQDRFYEVGTPQGVAELESFLDLR